jgi:hypothetical protein
LKFLINDHNAMIVSNKKQYRDEAKELPFPVMHVLIRA